MTLVQAVRDSYVGWVESKVLHFENWETTHLVCVPRTFFYPEPNLKLPHKGMNNLGDYHTKRHSSKHHQQVGSKHTHQVS